MFFFKTQITSPYCSLTLGLVSTTYMNSDLGLGLDFRMQCNICSSSRQRARKPERGWLHRQMAACNRNILKFRKRLTTLTNVKRKIWQWFCSQKHVKLNNRQAGNLMHTFQDLKSKRQFGKKNNIELTSYQKFIPNQRGKSKLQNVWQLPLNNFTSQITLSYLSFTVEIR